MTLTNQILKAMLDTQWLLNGIVMHPMTLYDLQNEGVHIEPGPNGVLAFVEDAFGYEERVQVVMDVRIPQGLLLFAQTPTPDFFTSQQSVLNGTFSANWTYQYGNSSSIDVSSFGSTTKEYLQPNLDAMNGFGKLYQDLEALVRNTARRKSK